MFVSFLSLTEWFIAMINFQEDAPKPGQPGQAARPAGGAPAAPRA